VAEFWHLQAKAVRVLRERMEVRNTPRPSDPHAMRVQRSDLSDHHRADRPCVPVPTLRPGRGGRLADVEQPGRLRLATHRLASVRAASDKPPSHSAARCGGWNGPRSIATQPRAASTRSSSAADRTSIGNASSTTSPTRYCLRTDANVPAAAPELPCSRSCWSTTKETARPSRRE
jgi:hypothetical protein